MKRIIILVFFIMASMQIMAQEIRWYPVDSEYYDPKEDKKITIKFDNIITFRIFIYKDYHVVLTFLDSKIDNTKRDISIYKGDVDKNGFIYFLNDYYDNTLEDKHYVICGKYNYLYETKSYSSREKKYLFGGAYRDYPLKLTQEIWDEIIAHNNWRHGESYILNQGITNIRSSSFLIEKTNDATIKYSTDNLLDKISILNLQEPNNFRYLNFKRAWAEGVKGPGIGEWLEMDFDWPSKELTIINGYLDFSKMNLYKDNNRLKRIKIESDTPSFAMEYEFEDVVKFHDIPLPEKTEHIKLTILEVYKGRKYDDTCVSFVAIPPKRWRSYEEEKAEVLEYLKKGNFFDILKNMEQDN